MMFPFCPKGNFEEVVNHKARKRNKIQILILIITDNDCVWIVLGAASVPNGKKPCNVCQYCEFDIATLPQYVSLWRLTYLAHFLQ